MVERPVAVTGAHIGPGSDRAQNVLARQPHRLRQRLAQCEVRSDRRRQSAARAVAVVRDDARSFQAVALVARQGFVPLR